MKILAIQWNVGNKDPLNLAQIIPNKGEGFDMIVLGLQESTYTVVTPLARSSSILKSAVIRDTMEPCYYDLTARIEEQIGEEFTKIKHIIRIQMQLFVYCRNGIKKLVSKVESSKENTGFLHVFPNKGGLCITLSIGHTSFAFISCHLTAHEGPVKCGQRNDSVDEILGGIQAGDKRFDPTLMFHHTIFLGDLNYRLTQDIRSPEQKSRRAGAMSMKISRSTGHFERGGEAGVPVLKYDSPPPHDSTCEEVLRMVEAEQWAELLQLDELTREMAAGRVLEGFTALAPEFPPTFKRIRGRGLKKYFRQGDSTDIPASLMQSNIKDADEDEEDEEDEGEVAGALITARHMRSEWIQQAEISSYYNLKRVPSYCDRILHKSLPGFSSPDHFRTLFFESVEQVFTSDHKPVRAGFEVKITQGIDGILMPCRALAGKGVRLSIGTEETANPLAFSGGPNERILMVSEYPRNLLKVEEPPTEILVEISELCASNLTEKNIISGLSDPYVVVTADPEQIIMDDGTQNLKTSVLNKSIHPEWKDEVIKFKIGTVDVEGMSENVHLFLSVWDQGAIENQLIGLMAIPMRDIFASYIANKDRYQFAGKLFSHALCHGKLQGIIRLTMVGSSLNIKTISKKSRESLNLAGTHTLGTSGNFKQDSPRNKFGKGKCSII